MKDIARDLYDEPIDEGDTVVDIYGNEHLIEFRLNRELFDSGDVYGYFIPDGSIVIRKGEQ